MNKKGTMIAEIGDCARGELVHSIFGTFYSNWIGVGAKYWLELYVGCAIK